MQERKRNWQCRTVAERILLLVAEEVEKQKRVFGTVQVVLAMGPENTNRTGQMLAKRCRCIAGARRYAVLG